jgi:hypothetical protein
MRRSNILLAGVSGLALAVSASAVLASDLAVRPKMATKAPILIKEKWIWWVEGGASHVGGGDPYIAGFAPPFSVGSKSWGWQGAVGVDYQPGGSPYHYSAAFRYSGFGSNSASSLQPGAFTATAIGANSASRKENNWAADFMVGRDLGLGHPSQGKIGIRVADIWGQTNGQVAYAFAPSGTQLRSYTQTNKFLGVGPRAAIEGAMPISPGWTFDYNGGVAALFGRKTADQTVGITGTFGGGALVCTAGCPINASTSSNGVVLNADAQVGVGYMVSPGVKLSALYRVEGYWSGMRSFDSAGNGVNLNRIYHGPTVKLTATY